MTAASSRTDTEPDEGEVSKSSACLKDIPRKVFLSCDRSILLYTLVVFFLTGGILFTAASSFPLTWDEGDAFDRADRIENWCGQMAGALCGQNAWPLDRASLVEAFPHTVVREGHPAGYTLVIATGRLFCKNVVPDLLPKKLEYRFGTLVLFAIAVAAVFYRLARQCSLMTAFLCVASLLLIPRLFGHTLIAACDSPLCASWMLVWAFFDFGLKHRRGAILWGLVLGLALSMKFTGWLIPVPFLVYACCCFLSRQQCPGLVRLLAIGLPLSVLTFIVLNPSIWYDPVGGLKTFFYLNTHRSRFNIPVLFFGEFYNLDHSLPWYNAFLWTAITVPVGILFFAIWQTTRGVFIPLVRRQCPEAWTFLLLLQFLILPLVRCLPHVPVHDGVRLFIPAFPFLGILAGLGAASLWGRFADPEKEPERGAPKHLLYFLIFRRLLVVSLLAVCIVNLTWYRSQWLSYYNGVIGGLSGAVRAGMERTYYWDALDTSALTWLNEQTAKSRARGTSTEEADTVKTKMEESQETVLFSAFSSATLRRYQEWGLLYPTAYTISESLTEPQLRSARWYVLQLRPSGLTQFDIDLIRNSKPVWVKRIRPGGFGPWRLENVSLLAIYDLHPAGTTCPTHSDNCPNPRP